MKVKEVYQQYRTPKNLQKHMLRVAALGTIILKNWNSSNLDDNAIIQTLVLHDIAKPVTFEISKQAQFVSNPEELKILEENIRFLIDNYGTNEHDAALKIFQEIGLSKNAQRLINKLEWHYIDRLMVTGDTEALIAIYCDMRIGPEGLLSIKERLHELHKRAPMDQFEKRLQSAIKLQKLIQSNVDIDLENIQDEQVEQMAKSLYNQEINDISLIQ